MMVLLIGDRTLPSLPGLMIVDPDMLSPAGVDSPDPRFPCDKPEVEANSEDIVGFERYEAGNADELDVTDPVGDDARCFGSTIDCVVCAFCCKVILLRCCREDFLAAGGGGPAGGEIAEGGDIGGGILVEVQVGAI
jgi:hypothetical protein